MNKKLAFTLIEVLIVIVVIGIISSFIIVSVSSITNNARIAKGIAFSTSIKNSLMMNLVSEWRLNETSGTNVSDQWGTNNGTWSGPAGSYTSPSWRTSSECVSNGCLAFDGTDDYVDCGNNASLDITNSIAISVWVKATGSSPVSGNQIILERISGTSNGYNILSVNGDLQGRLYPDSITSTAYFSNNVWHHVVMSNQNIANGWNLYFDGINVKQQNGVSALSSDGAHLYIGTRGGIALPFAGFIDDVRIYNAAIPTSQIEQNYYSGLNRLLVNNEINSQEYNQRITELINSFAKN